MAAAVATLSILVADDEEGIRALLIHWLQERGHVVTLSSSTLVAGGCSLRRGAGELGNRGSSVEAGGPARLDANHSSAATARFIAWRRERGKKELALPVVPDFFRSSRACQHSSAG